MRFSSVMVSRGAAVFIALCLAAPACSREEKDPPAVICSNATALLFEGDDLIEPDTDEVEESGAGLRKGVPGATAGDDDYCNDPAQRCGFAEGDCDGDGECVAGAVCEDDNGARFGFASTIDVCIPESCRNRMRDGTETDVDCGNAECGGCNPTCGGTPATPTLCTYHCKCSAGNGDCDSDEQCAAGSVCKADIGARFSAPATYDFCVPSPCQNLTLDPGEERVDCGGTCGPCVCPGANGDASFCSPSCPCSAGQGDCDRNLDCQPGLVCALDRGAEFGLNRTVDVCVAEARAIEDRTISVICTGGDDGSRSEE